MPPIFDLSDHFDQDIVIGDKTLPVHIKRFSRAEREVFEKRFKQLVQPRGVATMTDEAAEALEAERLRFADDAIREAITIAPGLILDRGHDVTDGAGLIGVFHARADVLGALVAAIYSANHLDGLIVKNSNSPRDSGTGSAPSTQARGGDRPGPIVRLVEPLATAPTEAATDANSGATDTPASSGSASAAMTAG